MTVATTRPETMLGDTDIAVSPSDPDKQTFVGKTVMLPRLRAQPVELARDRAIVQGQDRARSSDDQTKRWFPFDLLQRGGQSPVPQ